MWRTLLGICVVVMLHGCSSLNGAVTSYCQVSQPIYVSQGDALTTGTAKQILAHNETWAGICEEE